MQTPAVALRLAREANHRPRTEVRGYRMPLLRNFLHQICRLLALLPSYLAADLCRWNDDMTTEHVQAQTVRLISSYFAVLFFFRV